MRDIHHHIDLIPRASLPSSTLSDEFQGERSSKGEGSIEVGETNTKYKMTADKKSKRNSLRKEIW